MKQEILAIIPARGGSKGVARKNIKLLSGKPLIAYTIEAALKSKYITRTVISTEDEEIAKIAAGFGGQVPFLRPKELATDTSTTAECVLHLLNTLKAREGYEPDYICLLQCTSPLRTAEHIDEGMEKLLHSEKDGCISVCEAEVNPYWTKVFEGDSLKPFMKEGLEINRRQDLPRIFRLNGAFYILKTEVFLKNRSFAEGDLTGYIMDGESSVDIDSIMDFEIAELILQKRK